MICAVRLAPWLLLALIGLPAASVLADDPPPKPAPAAQPPAAPAAQPPAAPPKEPPKRGPRHAPKPAPEPPPLSFPDEGVMVRPNGDVVYFYRTNFVSASQLQQNLALVSIGDGNAIPVKLTPVKASDNTLLIEGDADAVEIAIEAAAYFDVSTPQVFIEAKVVEITYESNFEFGLDYLWSRDKVGPGTLWQGAQGTLPPPSLIGSGLPGGLPFQGTSLFFGLVGKNAQRHGLADLTLSAMELDGKAEILSKPSIIATQGIQASVTTQESRLQNIYDRADKNNTYYKASTLQTGVSLTVKATHIGESFVTLEIEPSVQGIQGLSAATGGTLQPVQTTRKAKTTVTMGDKETLVIGGLYTNATVKDKAKTPVISEIPVLGCLFTRTRDTKVKTELVFMLTPTIVRKTGEFRVIAPPAELDRLEGEEEEKEAKPCPCPTPPAEQGPPLVRSTPLARRRPKAPAEEEGEKEGEADATPPAEGAAAPVASPAEPPPPPVRSVPGGGG